MTASIREPLKELCQRLGLEYEDVAELFIRPSEVTATSRLRNEHGKFFVLPGGNDIATKSEVFKVET